jgi:hypothetical protein
MRSASIHITEEQLCGILEELDMEDAREMSKYILIRAKKFALAHRSIYSSNQSLQKKTDKIKLTSKSEAGLFAQIMVLVRRRNKHRGINLIQPGQTEWFQLKEVCKLATEFCNEFQLKLKDGYQSYIQISLSKMGKNFSMNRYKSLHASICNEFEALQEIRSDTEPSITREIHDYYMNLVAEKTGNGFGYLDDPEKYRYFIQVKSECHRLKVGYKFYINSQFNGLEWANSYPEPNQLVGKNAEKRLMHIAFENNVKLGKEERIIDWSKVK